MVSSACRGSCSTMLLKSSTRALNIDRSKNYSLPLQVETSVEYDLPSHIYPPKGSEPILMIHPAYTTPGRARKVSSQSPTVLSSPSVNVKPLSALQVHNNQQLTRTSSKSVQSKSWCACGIPNCNTNSSIRAVSVKNSNSQEQSVLTSRQVSQIPENIFYNNAVKNGLLTSDLKSQQKQLHQKAAQKQLQIHHQQQKQLQLQQQQYQQVQLHQYQERAKLQAQQLQQLQSQQKNQQKSNSVSRQPSNNEQVISWSLAGRCQGPCCQPRIGALPPTQAEFLAPGLPPSLLTRTPTRGPTAGSSPKLRARTRRGLSVANTINLPEYLGTSRSSRTSSVGGLAVGSSHAHSRSRSSSMLTSTPVAITAHQVATALDVVRSHVLTPRSLFASTQQQLQSNNINNTTSLLSTVGQSRDSGCSLSTEANNTSYSSNDCSKNADWWAVVDSGFCTPVDSNEDQVMETYEATAATVGSYTPMNISTSSISTSKDSNSSISNHWMRELTIPLNSSSSSSSMNSLHSSFLPPQNHHYITQPIWNLAY